MQLDYKPVSAILFTE